MPRRPEQFAQELRDLVGAFLAQRVEFSAGTLVTVTRAVVTTDARSATLYLSVLPPEQGSNVLELLHSQLYELQGALYERLHRHPSPRIRFALEGEDPPPT